MRRLALAILLTCILSMVSACAAGRESTGTSATFVGQNGGTIVLDVADMTVRLPHSKAHMLFHCGDESHTCFSDHHGFAFSFARECENVGIGGGTTKSKLVPKIVSVLHGNLWVVFDASPNYLFHYVIPKGIVGIYIGATPSYDFRSLFRNPNLQIGTLDASEYHITKHSASIAACRER